VQDFNFFVPSIVKVARKYREKGLKSPPMPDCLICKNSLRYFEVIVKENGEIESKKNVDFVKCKVLKAVVDRTYAIACEFFEW